MPDRNHSKQEREEMGIEDEEEDREFAVNRVLDDGFPDAVTLEMVAEATDRDGEMKRIKEEVMRGKKSKERRTRGTTKCLRSCR